MAALTGRVRSEALMSLIPPTAIFRVMRHSVAHGGGAGDRKARLRRDKEPGTVQRREKR
jgi:hypothetical protein